MCLLFIKENIKFTDNKKILEVFYQNYIGFYRLSR